MAEWIGMLGGCLKCANNDDLRANPAPLSLSLSPAQLSLSLSLSQLALPAVLFAAFGA